MLKQTLLLLIMTAAAVQLQAEEPADAVLDNLRIRIFELGRNLDHQGAAALLQEAINANPEQVDHITPLQEELQMLADQQLASWLENGRQMIGDGRPDKAAAHVKELLEVGEATMFPRIVNGLKRNLLSLELSGKLAAPEELATGLASLHDMQSEAEHHLQAGRLQQAELAYVQLAQLAADHPDAGLNSSKINTILQEIKKEKVKATAPLQVIFYDGFETILTDGRWGTIWTTGLRQRETAFNRLGYALASIKPRDGTAGVTRIIAEQPAGAPDKEMFRLSGRTILFFRYYVEAVKDVQLQNDHLSISFHDTTAQWNFYWSLGNPQRNEWQYAALDLNSFVSRGRKQHAPSTGDLISALRFGCGSKDDNVTLYLDDVAVVTNPNLYTLENAMTAQIKQIDTAMVKSKRESLWVNFQVLENCNRLAAARFGKIDTLIVGGLYTGSGFADSLQKVTGGRLYRLRGAGSRRTTTNNAIDALEKELPRRKPELALIMIGINDIITGEDLQSFAGRLEMIADLCIEHNSIPILCTLPPTKHEEYSFFVKSYNRDIQNLAKDYNVPLVKIAALLEHQPPKHKLYSGQIDLNRKGYKLINAKIAEVVEKLVMHVFKEAEGLE